MKRMKIVIAAAGTGGHINPGIAIANILKEKQPESEVIFIGTKTGIETDLVPRAGYKLQTIEAHGFNGKLNFDNVKKIIKTFLAIKDAKKILKSFEPDIVIGTGGYICVPVLIAAHKLKIPTAIHESNAYPGSSVRLLSKKVDAILVGFENARGRLPKARKVVVTGTPTKVKDVALSDDEKNRVMEEFGLTNEKPIILVTGGSQGAKKINEAVLDIIERKLNKDYQIIFAVGSKQYGIIKEDLREKDVNIEKIDFVKIVPYIYNMEEVMKVVDLIICRSGAMTVKEISIVGVPAIFIPLASVVSNRQEDNARVLEKMGSAKVILNNELDYKILSETINELLQDRDRLRQMGEKAKIIGIKNTDERIYDEIVKLVL